MAFTSKLAELFVEFTTRGVEPINRALTQMQGQLANVQRGADAVGAVASRAFSRASVALGGMVTAGVAMSSTGQVLSFHMERLSRTVAGLFAPEIQKAIDLVGRLTDRLQSLTDAQRAQIVRWVTAGAAMLATAIVIPRIVSGVTMLVGAIKTLTTALAVANIASGGIVTAIGVIGTALGALAVGAGVAEHGLGGLFASVRPLLESLGQIFSTLFEAIKPLLAGLVGIFERVAQAIQAVMPQIMAAVKTIAGAIGTVIDALAPMLPLIADAMVAWIEAVVPILPVVAQLVAALAEALAPILQILVQLILLVLDLTRPFISLFIQLAKVVSLTLVPALKILAAVLSAVASGIAFITGRKLDLAAPEFKAPESEGRGRGTLAPRVGGPESVEAMFMRIATASLRLGKSPEEQTLDVAKEQLGEQKKTNQILESSKSPVSSGKA